VETGTGVTESLLTSAESSEVGGGLGDNVVEELEGDFTGGGTVDSDIEVDLAVDCEKRISHRPTKALANIDHI
jgi:hypothetical protein